ncbi:MAG: hypothetical protein ACKVK0_17405, partial [Pirellulales bacterium]
IATRRCLLGTFLFLWLKRLGQHLGQVQSIMGPSSPTSPASLGRHSVASATSSAWTPGKLETITIAKSMMSRILHITLNRK